MLPVHAYYLLFVREYESLIKCQKSGDFHSSEGEESLRCHIGRQLGLQGSRDAGCELGPAEEPRGQRLRQGWAPGTHTAAAAHWENRARGYRHRLEHAPSKQIKRQPSARLSRLRGIRSPPSSQKLRDSLRISLLHLLQQVRFELLVCGFSKK